MNTKIAKIIGASALVIGTLGLAACSSSSPDYYGPGYGRGAAYAPAYGSAYAPGYAVAPGYAYAGEGDYDEYHTWHNRDWWVNNRRDWVNSHHNAWLNQQRVQNNAQVWEARQAQKEHLAEDRAASVEHHEDARVAAREHQQVRAEQQAHAAKHAARVEQRRQNRSE
jgi:hypothetical protein